MEAYGDVDELNSVLGVVIAQLMVEGETSVADALVAVQSDLFTVGANLATPAPEDGGRESAHIPALPAGRVEELEAWIDAAESELEPLKSFVLPGGTGAASYLHLARTVCRRAERRVVALARVERVNPEAVRYLNRLSDLLFVLARSVNQQAGIPELPWEA